MQMENHISHRSHDELLVKRRTETSSGSPKSHPIVVSINTRAASSSGGKIPPQFCCASIMSADVRQGEDLPRPAFEGLIFSLVSNTIEKKNVSSFKDILNLEHNQSNIPYLDTRSMRMAILSLIVAPLT
ncbi:hypothetical protein I7I51_08114 [Histoplasma capsulatum]|uniref:Uncharacterized protein n=1 Tax=Ajellomyces capsulatus TaxID=5037 RepID=A0A8A1LZJ1_AJECA|nr:hypothetical protein I7I51_08114 [Histoplasma capsulatum]